MPTKSFSQLLSDANDFDLCDGVVHLIADRHGNELDVNKLTEPERVVSLVWCSYGIIFNGGFQYLFEGNFEGDPGFILTAAAFRKIRCAEAADAFTQALALFPHNHLPADISERLMIYQSVSKHECDRMDRKFWDAEGDIEAKLAAFIRGHAAELERAVTAPH